MNVTIICNEINDERDKFDFDTSNWFDYHVVLTHIHNNYFIIQCKYECIYLGVWRKDTLYK